eukprot:CAMPEP_0179258818 /NCGR_PEP_ID=MMETSP0797-20121207/25509_1 /TAXON_ID=47934 /ORGANISM="Dinophysis acuminata, Strain DAEP01" /LENGTH=121 /DNA_ID=CAMNT_0020966857 /DNA_START=87 /DNA_END=449 /DNA_ORIENTATION=+
MARAAIVLTSLACSGLLSCASRAKDISLHGRGSANLEEDLSITAEEEYDRLDDYDKMDVDGDGYLTRDEWEAGVAAHSERNISLLEAQASEEDGLGGYKRCCHSYSKTCCKKNAAVNGGRW